MKKLVVILICVSFFTLGMWAGTEELFKKGDLHPVVKELKELFKDKRIQKAYKEAIKAVKDFKGDGLLEPFDNIWKKRSSDEFCYYFNNWYDFLATPTKEGLGFIEPFTQFYYNNDKAFDFLNKFRVDGKRKIFNWTVKFIVERGKFMDEKNNPEVLEAVKEWVDDPETHIDEYVMPVDGYKTFNDFFTRELRPGARPIDGFWDNGIVVAPADSIINMISSALTENSKIKTKGLQKLGVKDLLNKHASWKKFMGGTAISCVLMPSDYHHYHAPVSGDLIHYEEVKGIYNGIQDSPQWFHNNNVGESGGNFSVFEQFHRGVFIFKTKDYGYVAMVAVGLNTISEIKLELNSLKTLDKFKKVSREKPQWVYKGTKLGGFRYGGSLNILLFEPGVYPANAVHQGQRIGTMTPKTKK
ncbi:MAG: phosphatidylserine decarboxylase [bacterium]|nr:phosphatidylserine decarboxylase [bacterium]